MRTKSQNLWSGCVHDSTKNALTIEGYKSESNRAPLGFCQPLEGRNIYTHTRYGEKQHEAGQAGLRKSARAND